MTFKEFLSKPFSNILGFILGFLLFIGIYGYDWCKIKLKK
jgi:hypothetical protein